MKNFKSGALIAIAAGSLFASACKKDKESQAAEPPKAEQPAPAPSAPTQPEAKPEDKPAEEPAAAAEPAKPSDEKVSKIDCAGVNACKGQGTCATEKHACGGQNACKGQGVLAMTEEECKAKGGSVVAKK